MNEIELNAELQLLRRDYSTLEKAKADLETDNIQLFHTIEELQRLSK